MLIAGAAVLVLWLLVVAIIAGLCISAAQGDRAQRRELARRAARAPRRRVAPRLLA